MILNKFFNMFFPLRYLFFLFFCYFLRNKPEPVSVSVVTVLLIGPFVCRSFLNPGYGLREELELYRKYGAPLTDPCSPMDLGDPDPFPLHIAYIHLVFVVHCK